MKHIDKVIEHINFCLTNTNCIFCERNYLMPEDELYCNCSDDILREVLDVLEEVRNNGMANN